MTVADDLLKNDGQKFLEMMEQLAERRMQREEEAAVDVEEDSEDEDDEGDDLGDMVQNLHELSSFFQDASDAGHGHGQGYGHGPHPHHRQLEARVAAILAKSSTTDSGGGDVPQTPFVDVFNVGGAPPIAANGGMRGLSPTFEDSEDSDSELAS